MPSPLLVDSGPLVAWLNARDRHHQRATEFFRARKDRLVTTWPVITEVCHLVPQRVRAILLRWAGAGGIDVWHVPQEQASVLADLIERYDDLPMDLADASLVWLSGEVASNLIATMDRTDFAVYRGARGRTFRNVFFE